MSNRYMIHTEHASIGVDWAEDGETVDITIKNRGIYKQAEMNVGEDGVPGFTVCDCPPNPELEIGIKVDDIRLLISMLECARREAYNLKWDKNLGNFVPAGGATQRKETP